MKKSITLFHGLIMTHSFASAPLESICEEIVDCPHSTPKWTDSGVVVIRNQNIRGGRLDFSSISFTDEENYQKRSKRIALGPNDLIITREAPMGEVCLIPEELRCCLGQRMVALRANKDLVLPKYLLFALQGRHVQHQIGFNEGTGSTVSNMRIPVLKGLDIPLPTLQEQKAIAHILGTLDDKIEINQKMNETLEEIAKTIFKSWFVDFDPVRAKMEGRATGLPDEISDLFPDKLVDSEIGEIPKGWKIQPLEQVIEVYVDNRGKTPPIEKTGVPLVEIKHLDPSSQFPNLKTDKYVSEETFSNWFRKYVNKNDILISTVGTIGMTSIVFNSNFAIAQNVLGLRFSSDMLSFYMFNLIKNTYFQHQVNSRLVETVQKSIKRKDLNQIPILTPGIALLELFKKTIEPILNRQYSNENENSVLSELRDTLLPKLISGELQIPDAEKFLEEVGV